MRCFHCNQEIPDGSEQCFNCGANQGAGATVLLDQTYNPYGADVQSNRTDELTTLLEHSPYGNDAVPAGGRPAIQFATNRSLWKMILFGILTLGIYDVVIWCKMVTELNVAACRYDGKRTMPYFAMAALAPATFGIYVLVWCHKFSNRVGAEVSRRGYDYSFGAKTFWLWNVLGSLILVGPFIYLHKLMTAMNAINADFNENG